MTWSDARDRIQARVIEDSISPAGIRLTTVEATIHRFVLAELNTHRTMSRNSESSRAVPFHKRLAKVREHPAIPASFPAEQRGMSGGAELEGEDLLWATGMIEDIHDFIVHRTEKYVEDVPDKERRLHKSVLNRYLEPFLWHTVVITATEWEGFFEQRCHEAAQPEIRLAAEAIRAAMGGSNPEELDYGEWHMPYIQGEDWEAMREFCRKRMKDPTPVQLNRLVIDQLKRVSGARCARTSYVTHDGRRDVEDDLRLYGDLTLRDGSSPRRQPGNPVHWSPLEHPATPCRACEERLSLVDRDGYGKVSGPNGRVFWLHDHPGNFRGWFQHRHELDRSPYTKV